MKYKNERMSERVGLALFDRVRSCKFAPWQLIPHRHSVYVGLSANAAREFFIYIYAVKTSVQFSLQLIQLNSRFSTIYKNK